MFLKTRKLPNGDVITQGFEEDGLEIVSVRQESGVMTVRWIAGCINNKEAMDDLIAMMLNARDLAGWR